MPSDVDPHVGVFDRFASLAAQFTAKPWFFSLCALLVLLWAPSYVVVRDVDTWQLIINTATTIVTFLLVALLQNTQTRADRAVQAKLNAIAEALADLMKAETGDRRDLRRDIAELEEAVGLEDRESA
jgi:low affinity Fe/Cu permease